ncbi:MAG: type I-U CRISPR-associated protein Cas7 [Firmicutes bacterium]|nr:type I-U CRISPR-associated protein Cas7 [Bacillota bacterium]
MNDEDEEDGKMAGEPWGSWVASEPRLVVEVEWRPLASDRFQPTNFPNLGPAAYEVRDGGKGGGVRPMLVVESPQSMINRLEELSWDGQGQRPRGPFAGLPYVEVVGQGGAFLTSSRLEAHRLNGAWLRDSVVADDGRKWIDYLNEEMGLEAGAPLPWPQIYATLYRLDPFCLVHGVFFADQKIVGQPKVARAVTPTMDAEGARMAPTGGVKKDSVAGGNEEGRGSQEGYGFIPYPRTDFVADRIVSRFVLDLEQIRGYGLGREETDVLTALALWEILAFASRPRRLRTFCDLEPAAPPRATLPQGAELPSVAALEVWAAGHVPQTVASPLRLTYAGKR